MSDGFWAGRFTVLDSRRQAHLTRCRRCAEVTIPHLLPPEGSDENTPLPTPWQGVGADAVNNLTAKLLLTLMPPNSPFFKMDIDEAIMDELKNELGEEDFKQRVQYKLAQMERRATKYTEQKQYRVQLFKALRLLVCIGNCLLERLPSGKLKVYRLDRYTVRRDTDGEVKEIIIKQNICADDVPADMGGVGGIDTKSQGAEQTIPLYTYCIRRGDKWETGQELMGQLVPESDGEYPLGKCPFIPLTWTLADGENYGRGHVEEHLGDFTNLDGLSQSLLEGAQIAALVKFLIESGGTTNIDDVRNAPNGGFAVGNEDDISVLHVDKYADFKVAFDQAVRLEDRLSRAFMLVHSVQRNAERVTAEEIRLMAQELEDALGGVYSVLSQELQLPLATLIIDDMQKQKLMPALPPGVTPVIVTGFDALGRGHELVKLRSFLNDITPLGEETLSMWLKIGGYITRVATAYGIDVAGLVASEQEVNNKMKAMEQKRMMEQFGPEVLKAAQAAAQQKGKQA